LSALRTGRLYPQ